MTAIRSVQGAFNSGLSKHKFRRRAQSDASLLGSLWSPANWPPSPYMLQPQAMTIMWYSAIVVGLILNFHAAQQWDLYDADSYTHIKALSLVTMCLLRPFHWSVVICSIMQDSHIIRTRLVMACKLCFVCLCMCVMWHHQSNIMARSYFECAIQVWYSPKRF